MDGGESMVDEMLDKAQRLYADGKIDKALDECSEALFLTPKRPDALYLKGLCLFSLNRFRESEEALSRACGISDEPLPFLLLALSRFRQEKKSSAFSALQKFFSMKGSQKAIEDYAKQLESSKQPGAKELRALVREILAQHGE